MQNDSNIVVIWLRLWLHVKMDFNFSILTHSHNIHCTLQITFRIHQKYEEPLEQIRTPHFYLVNIRVSQCLFKTHWLWFSIIIYVNIMYNVYSTDSYKWYSALLWQYNTTARIRNGYEKEYDKGCISNCV